MHRFREVLVIVVLLILNLSAFQAQEMESNTDRDDPRQPHSATAPEKLQLDLEVLWVEAMNNGYAPANLTS